MNRIFYAVVLSILLGRGVCADEQDDLNVSSTSGTATTVLSLGPAQTAESAEPAEEIEVESLTDKEWQELQIARKGMKEIEDRIRAAHGESRRLYVGWMVTADCKSRETRVEIRGRQVLITTQFAGRGDNPPCF